MRLLLRLYWGERHHEVLLEIDLDQPHVIGRREPHVVEHVAERQPVLDAGAQHGAVVLVLADGGPPLEFARLRVGELLVLLD